MAEKNSIFKTFVRFCPKIRDFPDQGIVADSRAPLRVEIFTLLSHFFDFDFDFFFAKTD